MRLNLRRGDEHGTGGGTFTISVTTVAGCTSTSARKIVATGSVPVRGGNAQVQIEVTLDQVSYPFRWAAFAAVPNEIIGMALGSHGRHVGGIGRRVNSC